MPNDFENRARFVSYLRVSTTKQGASGLGIEAQRAAVRAHIQNVAGQPELLEEFVEVESGKRKDRPQLLKAIERCELAGASLIIARLDRLSRNAHFLLSLQEAKVPFVACDNPHADKFTVGILALVAQKEAESISERTRAALSAAKARGIKLGNPKGASHLAGRGNREAVRSLKATSQARALKLKGQLEEIKREGHLTLAAMASELTRRGIVTSRGGTWHPMAVKRIIERLI